jgi:hypothetical protein
MDRIFSPSICTFPGCRENVWDKKNTYLGVAKRYCIKHSCACWKCSKASENIVGLCGSCNDDKCKCEVHIYYFQNE